MRRSYLNQASAGDVVDDVLVISGKQFSPTSAGNKFFVKAFVSDRTCQMPARMWNATRDIFNALPEAGFVRIRGHVENYQSNLQFIIEQIAPPKEGTYDVTDLIPHTDKDIGQMLAKVQELCGSIQNRHVAAIVQAYLDDADLMQRFSQAPAAQSFHHAFLGGLLEHTLNAMEVADLVVRFYPGLNRDLVLAGIFLHDIAKTWELTYDCSFGYSDGGQLVGHIVKSAMWVQDKAREAEAVLGERIPDALVNVLQHIILSHHGTAEFGSPRTPSTPEALAVHAIENMDAKLTMALQATRSGEPGQGSWTEYMKAFSGRLYRPDVAPAEVVDAEPLPEGEASGPPGEARATDIESALKNPLFEVTPRRGK
jgi:3'-5' exoribonuclease